MSSSVCGSCCVQRDQTPVSSSPPSANLTLKVGLLAYTIIVIMKGAVQFAVVLHPLLYFTIEHHEALSGAILFLRAEA